MFRLKISTKVLVYFLAVSLIPLLVVDFSLVGSARNQLLNAAVTKQQLIADNTAADVDSYLQTKIDNLFFLSRLISSHESNSMVIRHNLAVLIKQDHDVKNLSLLNVKGYETLSFDSKGEISKLTDQSGSDAFKAVTYLSGKEYVSSVSYGSNNKPQITIAVPQLTSNFNQYLTVLQKANFGNYKTSEDIQAIIVATYDISDLWQSVLSTKIGSGGYAYVVDGLGNLVAHPDKNYLSKNKKITQVQAVKDYIAENLNTGRTESETGQEVISTPRKLKNNSWAVIVEEPVTSIYSSINNFIKLSAIVMASAIGLSILVGLVLRRQLVGPIKKLSFGAKQLGTGNFDQKIAVNTNDELEDLADTFNEMGGDIKNLISDLQIQNLNVAAEKNKLSAIISSVNDGVIAIDSNCNIVTVNPQAAVIMNMTAAVLMQKNLPSLLLWEKDGKKGTVEISKPGIYRFDEVTIDQNGKKLYLDIVVSVLEQHAEDVAAIITIHNLTPKHELEAMKLDFVSIAAHELRTPLTVVRGYLSLLNTDALHQLSVYNIENLQRAIVGSEELSKLINNLLNVSRIERGKLTINLEKIDIANLVKEIVLGQQVAAKPKEQRLSYDGPKAHVSSPIDKSAISEVIHNLINNAIKYTPPKSNISVHLSIQDKNVLIEVQDDGPGISEEAQKKLFTKFFRVEPSMTSGNRGTGLGLYISKRIIELHNGNIGVRSKEKQGTIFYITLPLYDDSMKNKLSDENINGGEGRGWITKRTVS